MAVQALTRILTGHILVPLFEISDLLMASFSVNSMVKLCKPKSAFVGGVESFTYKVYLSGEAALVTISMK